MDVVILVLIYWFRCIKNILSFDGTGQIQVSTVPGVGLVGSFRDFAGQAGFQGHRTVAAAGTGILNAQGTGVAALFGNGMVNVNIVGQKAVEVTSNNTSGEGW